MKIKQIMKIVSLSMAVILLGLSGPSWSKDISGKARDFTLKSNQGENIRLSDLRGQVVMLNFWASWCGPCRQEMPILDKMYQRYASVGFNLLGINVESDPKKADKFLKERPVTFPILYDTTKKVSEQYKVAAMPTTVLIDCDGNIAHVHKAYKAGDEKKYIKLVKGLIRSCK